MGMLSAKVVANAFSAGFQRMPHLVWPVPLGSNDLTVRYKVFRLFAVEGVGRGRAAIAGSGVEVFQDGSSYTAHPPEDRGVP